MAFLSMQQLNRQTNRWTSLSRKAAARWRRFNKCRKSRRPNEWWHC